MTNPAADNPRVRSVGWMIATIVGTLISWLAAAVLFLFLLMGTAMGGDSLGMGYADWAGASLGVYLLIAALGPLAALIVAIVAPGPTSSARRRCQIWAFTACCASLPLAVLAWLALVLIAVRVGSA